MLILIFLDNNGNVRSDINNTETEYPLTQFYYKTAEEGKIPTVYMLMKTPSIPSSQINSSSNGVSRIISALKVFKLWLNLFYTVERASSSVLLFWCNILQQTAPKDRNLLGLTTPCLTAKWTHIVIVRIITCIFFARDCTYVKLHWFSF